MQVSIIIVNYNTKNLTLNCIKSVYQHTLDLQFEIIVVDNASSDGSVQAIREQYPQVILIEAGDNIGFGRANNLGVRAALGEYLFLLNSDTLLVENSIKKLYDLYVLKQKNTKIGILGCVLLDADGNIGPTGNMLPTVHDYISYFIKKAINKNYTHRFKTDFDNFTPVEMVSGADMFISKELFNKLNGFDEKIFLYFEDTDLQKRLIKMNFVNYVTNNTKIYHLEGGSCKLNNWKRIVIQKSQNYYFRKNEKIWFPLYICFQIPFTIVNFAHPKYTFKENLSFNIQNIKTLFKL